MPDKLVGKVLGDFRLEELIGTGAFGKVYKSVQVSLNRPVAVKVLEEGIFTPDDITQRFVREAEFIAKLEHPNIVPIYGAGHQDNYYYYAMRFVEGKTLAERLERGLPMGEGFRYCADICGALHYAHGRGLIHRDIKPANIMIAYRTALLTDFGLARVLEKSSITTSGAYLGTPLYFAPEQAERKAAGPKSDLFAMGIILYQIAVGRHPYAGTGKPGPSIDEVLGRIVRAEFDPPRTIQPALPERVEEVILRAMKLNPDERYGTAREMQHALISVLALPQIAATDLQFSNQYAAVPAKPAEPPAPPSETPKSETASRRKFGKYVLHEKLGQGGMGIVYRAEQTDLGRMVALKVLQGEEDLDPQTRERFQREARAAAQLRHPNIVPVHEVGEVDGKHYFTMDLVEGGDLDGRNLGIRKSVEAIREASKAVHYAHESGVIHRDLKPANLMLDSSGRIYVMDFGLARSTRVDSKLSVTGTVLGTPHYMAPEQARGSRQADARSDVYSLGASLYSLVTGSPPFPGENATDIMLRVLNEEPLKPRTLRPDLPRDVETIILKAMEKDPSRRYPTASELAEDLRRFLDGEPILARPPSVVYRLKKRLLKRRAVVATALIALAILGIVLALLLPRLFRTQADLSLLEELAPLEDAVREAQPFFYIEGGDIEGKLGKVRTALEKLEKIAADERKSGRIEVWKALGTGWYLVGETAKAEEALLHAGRLDPEDGLARYSLGKIYLERSREARVGEWGETPKRLEEKSRTWVARALACLQHPAAERAASSPVERHVVQAYRAMARGEEKEVVRLCEEGLKAAGEGVGSEELHNLIGLVREGRERVEAYTKALERKPHYAWGFFMRGVARYHLGDYDGAIDDLSESLRLNPRNYESHRNRGLARRKKGDFTGALDDYNAALQLSPGHASLLDSRGNAFGDGGDFDSAIRDYSEAIRRDPGYALPYAHRAMMRWRKGKDEKGALQDCDSALRADPECAFAYAIRGIVFFEQKKYKDSIEEYTKAIRLDPEYAEAYYNRSGVRQASGDLEGAVADCDKTVRCDPRFAKGWSMRAYLRLRQGDAKGSLSDAEEGVRNAPDDPEVRAIRGDARKALGDHAGAIEDFTFSLSKAPNDASVWNSRGIARHARGDREGALKDFSEALRIKPDHAVYLVNRGNLYSEMEKLDAALREYEAAIRLDPDSPSPYYNRALVREKKQDWGGAEADYDKVLEIDPRHAESFLFRGNLRGRRGDRKGQMEDYQKALSAASPQWPHRAEVERALRELTSKY